MSKRTSWTKEPPYTGDIHQGCLNCPPVLPIAPMNMLIGVGFGYAAVTRDKKVIYQEKYGDDNIPTLQKFEDMAEKDPDHDWRVILNAPLRGRTYQRQGVGEWVLIESNSGFA
jgi:hypothetical protein